MQRGRMESTFYISGKRKRPQQTDWDLVTLGQHLARLDPSILNPRGAE